MAGESEAPAANIHCDQLPEARQALCWMVVACGALNEESRREECYRVAADTLEHGGLAQESTDPGTETSEPSPAAPATAVAAPTQAPASETRLPPAQPPSQVVAKTVAQQVLDIPRRFSAQVTAQRKLVRNRQLLVLDDKLLFETDNADTAGIDPGDEVDVVKASSRRGRSYQIAGPSKRAVTGVRLRCERMDLSAGNRRKCALLLGDKATAPN